MEKEGIRNDFSREDFIVLLNQNAAFRKEILELKQDLEAAEKRINWFVEQIKLGKQRRFGKQNEATKYIQLTFENIFDEDEKPVDESSKIEEASLETITYTRKKKTVGRKIDTSKLPREIVTHDLSAAEKFCDNCGGHLEKFGEDRSEQLEYIPEQIKVIEHISSKYACRCCSTVKSASKPEMPIAKSMAAPSLITEVIIKKYEHHLPWYRQSKIFAQNKIDIPANTICNWFLQAGEVLMPLSLALEEQVNLTHVLQADETPVKVLADNIRGYMWGYHSCEPTNRFILFKYHDSRSGKVASDILKDYKGVLQSDGYSGYNELRSRSSVIGIGCWAHCRRKFVDIVKVASVPGKASEIVKYIGELYQIEAMARDRNLDFIARQKLRQKSASPVLEKIYTTLANANAPPKSSLGMAITYALNQWPYLKEYTNHGEVEIDNNLIENQIRPFALGRRNWLFLGNEKAANIAAFFCSIIQTCRLNNVDARKYLVYVLTKAGDMRRGKIDPKVLLPQFIGTKFS